MNRMKLQLPKQFHHSIIIPIRIDDINYGNHLSNDAYLKYMHECRMQLFSHYNMSEMDIGGASVIMGDTGIVYKKECFYGQSLKADISISDIGVRSFNIYYRFSLHPTGDLVAEAKTGMVCFDYQTRKTVSVPETFIKLFKTV